MKAYRSLLMRKRLLQGIMYKYYRSQLSRTFFGTPYGSGIGNDPCVALRWLYIWTVAPHHRETNKTRFQPLLLTTRFKGGSSNCKTFSNSLATPRPWAR